MAASFFIYGIFKIDPMLSELEALVALSSIPMLGPIKIRLLIQYYGSALAALEASPTDIAELPDFGPKIAQGWTTWKHNGEWQQNLELANKLDVEIIPYTSPKYPKRLLDIADHPILLYVQGQLLPSDNRCIAIVGTRQASIYGKEMAEKFSHELAEAGFTIVSGLARGIDTSAHIGALATGRTIGVIGSGLANIYPPENKKLASAMAQKGALITEFPMATPPDKQNFPQRNRIVSGMTLATLLIEAPVRSGAMITMEKALGYKRKLFALPGRIDCDTFHGNHLLIKNGHAQLVENVQDIIDSFGNLFGIVGPIKSEIPASAMLGEEEGLFLQKLPNHEVTIDEIVQLTSFPVMKVNVMVMSLILKKSLKEFPGKIYRKTRVQ